MKQKHSKCQERKKKSRDAIRAKLCKFAARDDSEHHDDSHNATTTITTTTREVKQPIIRHELPSSFSACLPAVLAAAGCLRVLLAV